MLSIDMEFRKGILFIRLSGSLTKDTVSKLNTEVTDLIKDNGIRNIVFNVENLNNIDMKGINALLHNYELTRNNNGKSLLCKVDNSLVRHRLKNSRLFNYMYEISDELTAFSIMDI